MTEKLYYRDSHLKRFTARVQECERGKKYYEVVLDRTAFFPEGGGQSADTGTIGTVRVADVHEKGDIIHYTEQPLQVGSEYCCLIDWEQRYRRMQNHSGEHIVSGLVHKRFGYDNVGFHMGENFMTLDFSGELSWEQLMEVEYAANEAVRENIEYRVWFPDEKELETLEYRSKLELTRDVRIVEIPGIDRCACCAPHVYRSGEIGLIKILDFMRHRGGVRVSVVCGMDALDAVRNYQENVTRISGLLSAKRQETASAVERLLSDKNEMNERTTALSTELVKMKADAFPATEGNICIFDELLSEAGRRELVNLLMQKSRIAAVFAPDGSGKFKYIIGSRFVDLRACSREINTGISGRGGGSPAMIQGNASGSRDQISHFMESYANQTK